MIVLDDDNDKNDEDWKSAPLPSVPFKLLIDSLLVIDRPLPYLSSPPSSFLLLINVNPC